MKNLLALILGCSQLSLYAAALSPFEPLTAWEKKQVRVCWGDQTHQSATVLVREKHDFLEFSANHKKWIKDIITREFTKEIGLEFIGWENCGSAVESFDVVMFRTEPPTPDVEGAYSERGGQATIGQRGQQSTSYSATTGLTTVSLTRSNFPNLNVVVLNTKTQGKAMDSENYIKMLALHEFGHTAGLRHQHIRIANVKEDENCKRVPDLKIHEEPVLSSTRFAGPYDHNSIMNYCWINVLTSRTGLNFKAKNLNHRVKLTDPSLYTVKPVNAKKQEYTIRVGLSTQDREALKCMYVYDSDTQKEKCNVPK